MSALVTVAPKLEKLIPLLASDKPGEVVACAAAIGRALRSAGRDWHDLTAALTHPAPHPTPPPPPPPPRADWGEALAWRDIPLSQRLDWLARVVRNPKSSPWEQDFCRSIHEQLQTRRTLSEKQVGVLDRLARKFGGSP